MKGTFTALHDLEDSKPEKAVQERPSNQKSTRSHSQSKVKKVVSKETKKPSKQRITKHDSAKNNELSFGGSEAIRQIMIDVFTLTGPTTGPTIRITKTEQKIIQAFMEKELVAYGITTGTRGTCSMSKLFRYALMYMIKKNGNAFAEAARLTFSNEVGS